LRLPIRQLPDKSGDKIFLKFRVLPPKFEIALCCIKPHPQSKTFFRFFCAANGLHFAQQRRAGESESTSGVKSAVLKIEID